MFDDRTMLLHYAVVFMVQLLGRLRVRTFVYSIYGVQCVRTMMYIVVSYLPAGWRTRAEGRCVDCADSSGTWWALLWRLDLSGIELGENRITKWW